MLITARDPAAERRFDGVLAHARSDDMVDVEARAAADRAEPGSASSRWRRSVASATSGCCSSRVTPTSRATRGPSAPGTCSATRRSVRGTSPRARPFEDEPWLFAAQLVQRRDGSWALLGFLEGGDFEVVDPIGVELTGGTLRRSAPGP